MAGVVSLSLGTVSNPWSTAPFGPISFSLLYADTATAYLSQQCTGVYQSTSQKGTMSSFRINFLSSISYKSFFQTGWFKITNPLPASGGQLHVLPANSDKLVGRSQHHRFHRVLSLPPLRQFLLRGAGQFLFGLLPQL